MNKANVPLLLPVVKLIPYIPDTDLSELVAATYSLAQVEPRILKMIDDDRDAYGLKKKEERIRDQDWVNSHGTPLPGFDLTEDQNWRSNLNLSNGGRPRMPAIAVLICLNLRGSYSGFKDRDMMTLLAESRTLEIVFRNLGMDMPGASTMIDNVNAVSNETREFILDVQARQTKAEGLDNFKKLTTDSTGVEANSKFPTDSGTISGLTTRSVYILDGISEFGIKVNLPQITDKLVTDIENLHKQIQLTSGKKDSAKKRKKHYRKIMKLAKKVRQFVESGLSRALVKAEGADIIPSQKKILMADLEQIRIDLECLKIAVANADKRINRDEKVATEDKVLSLADEDAAMIVKGGREPILGYKPQIARSENGLIVGLIVPEGNAADSGQLRKVVDAAIKRTCVTPSILSFDDGYTNETDRNYYLDLGIGVVSFSGSKGKNLIPPEEYESKAYQRARNYRSAVESLMFVLKHNHKFDRMMRRGIDNVRAEMLEKAISYNTFRMILLRQRLEEKKAAA